MVQNPKGGGLSSTFGGTQQLGGVQKTTDFLEKSTWTLGAILIALILLSNMSNMSSSSGVTIDKSNVAPILPTQNAPEAAIPSSEDATTTENTQETPAN